MYFFVPEDSVNLADVTIFCKKLAFFWAKIVPSLKAIV